MKPGLLKFRFRAAEPQAAKPPFAGGRVRRAAAHKLAWVFVAAVLVPSLVLAWLALRSLRDQQFVLERQQALIYQSAVRNLATEVHHFLAERQREFGVQVESLLADQDPVQIAALFDQHLLQTWPWAEVGFVVSLDGIVIAPSAQGRPAAYRFLQDNGGFLSNRETPEVYSNVKGMNVLQLEEARESFQRQLQVLEHSNLGLPSPPSQAPSPHPSQARTPLNAPAQHAATPQIPALPSPSPSTPPAETLMPQQAIPPPPERQMPAPPQALGPIVSPAPNPTPSARYPQQAKNQALTRKVMPQVDLQQSIQNFSRLTTAEGEFRQLIGDANEGSFARFLRNRLQLIIWYRSAREASLVFGAQLELARFCAGLAPLFAPPAAPSTAAATGRYGTSWEDLPQPFEVCLALLDDTGKPVARSHPEFVTDWKRPFVATEVGEALPHWEVAAYLLNPTQLAETADTIKLTLSLIILVLLLAIGAGGWLIVRDLRRALFLARQKTDFVSNVSHELKTPLTSIRMFSELLAEGRVRDPEKQRSYLDIITAEAARLTRLINNVLDFARLERGDRTYRRQPLDIVALVQETVTLFRPHLDAAGFQVTCRLPEQALHVLGDPDALAQVVVNLLSNAEKYAGALKEIELAVLASGPGEAEVDVQVLDRGLGIPKGLEKRIFEQFFRAHDALASGIQGSGLGLTLAQQIARAHGGEVFYRPRPGGGSQFTLRLPRAERT